MYSSPRSYWTGMSVLCLLLVYLHGGQTFETKSTKEYEKEIRRIVSEFSPPGLQHSNNGDYDIKGTSKSLNEGDLQIGDNAASHRDTINNLKDSVTSRPADGALFTKFPCDRIPPSKAKPDSVHRLRPADVDVVAAIGDSLTAGKAAGSRGVAAVLFDYRGLSWSIGGDGTFDTLHSLPNILREYNPDLYGFSNSIGDLMSQTARLNVAKSGATSNNLAFQAALLIQRLKNDPIVDFENDWKVITILIGANDLCRSCKGMYTPQRYIAHLRSALDILHDSVPRTFVNLVEVMPVELARFLPRDDFCKRIESYYCGCAVNPRTEHHYSQLISYREEFQRLTEELISSGVYDDKEDFTVVVQPFYKNFSIQMVPGTQEIDYSIFAVDCFHLSMKGQSRGGLGLWNNMLQPVGHKSTDWGITEKMLCPTEKYPLLATAKNSKILKKRFRGTKHILLKKIAKSSIDELKQRGRIRAGFEILDAIHAVKKVKNDIENRKTEQPSTERGRQWFGVMKSNESAWLVKHAGPEINTSPPPIVNVSTRTNGPTPGMWREEPEVWEIFGIVMGWTLLMSSVLVYCVSLKGAKSKGKASSPPPAVVIATVEKNKY